MSEVEASTPIAIGDKKNPIAVDKKWKLLANLDEEFFQLLDDAYNHFTGFKKIDFDDDNLGYGYLYAVRYLVLCLIKEYNYVGL